MRPKTSEGRAWVDSRRSDLTAGDNPWNGTRETWSSPKPRVPACRCTTLWKARIQRPTSAPAAVMSWRPWIVRVRVWWAGEFEGSGKAFIHDSMRNLRVLNVTRSKRYIRVRGTHDFETTQHALSVVGSSCRWSTTISSISGGRKRVIVVVRQNFPSWFHFKRTRCVPFDGVRARHPGMTHNTRAR